MKNTKCAKILTKVPVVAVAGAVVTALTVLTEGTSAVVCDSVINVVGITVLSVKHTDKDVLQRYIVIKFNGNCCKVQSFLCVKAATALARLNHRNSVGPSVCLSVTRVDHSKTVQARITKSSRSAA